tara:strand:- start:1523 stop:1897 length:375 start_codon:yes stop_codon:yes gene_type:complete
MQVEGVNAVNTSSSPAVGQSTAGNEVSAPANVNDSSGGIDASPVENNNLDEEENNSAPQKSPSPTRSMSTSDFLGLHNDAISNHDNVMIKMMKILEAVLALKLLDATLESAQGSEKENSFKEIA